MTTDHHTTHRRLSKRNEARLMEIAAELHEMAKAEDAWAICMNGYSDWDEPCFPTVHLAGSGNPTYAGDILYHDPDISNDPEGEADDA